MLTDVTDRPTKAELEEFVLGLEPVPAAEHIHGVADHRGRVAEARHRDLAVLSHLRYLVRLATYLLFLQVDPEQVVVLYCTVAASEDVQVVLELHQTVV